jgi:S-adenosylmethionine hydrolase
MPRPVVALLTDFGLRDHYVGTMKGVVLSVCPEAALVDITHDIAPQDVFSAALELAASYRYFPVATVFVAVVDPGVGSARRALAAESGGYYFVGPDNGIFSFVFRESTPTLVVELRERKFARSTISHTFEGRDRFAPAAGWIAKRTPLRSFGPPIDNHVSLEFPEAIVSADAVRGEVIYVDRFGNLITNIAGRLLAEPTSRVAHVTDRGNIRIVRTYAAVAAGELCGLIGSSGYFEIAVNRGSAAALLNVSRGARVEVFNAPMPGSP